MRLAKALDFLRERAVEKNGALIVPFFACREAARESGITPREAEALALENGICPSRYERNVGAIGMEGQAKLLRSRAAVVGCGGLGGWVIEILARSGVGELVVFDGDVFEDGNLNRQMLADEENIGTSKAEAAAKRVESVNGAVSISAFSKRLDGTNAAALLSGCGVVVDATDSNSARREIFKVCRELGIPFIHGAIGGFFGQTGVFFPEDEPHWLVDEASDEGAELETGCPAFTPPFIASLQAAEAVKLLAGLDCQANGTLLWFDIGRYDMQKIKMGR